MSTSIQVQFSSPGLFRSVYFQFVQIVHSVSLIFDPYPSGETVWLYDHGHLLQLNNLNNVESFSIASIFRCSSWNSHYPAEIQRASQAMDIAKVCQSSIKFQNCPKRWQIRCAQLHRYLRFEVAVHGLNSVELEMNEVATERHIQDLVMVTSRDDSRDDL